jgi:radical SAM superfamily enzyme YgiQ (UPF0313 family)
MKVVDDFLNKNNWSPQQVQDYIPLPMTVAAAMYYCGKNTDGREIHVNRGLKERRPQIKVLKKKRKFKSDKDFPRKPSSNRGDFKKRRRSFKAV